MADDERLVKFSIKVDPLTVRPLRVSIGDVEIVDPLGGGTFPFAADIRRVFDAFNEKRPLVLNAMAWINWMEWSGYFSWLGDLTKAHGRFVRVEITPLDKRGEGIPPLGSQPGFFADSYFEILYDVSAIDAYLVEGGEIDFAFTQNFSDLLLEDRNIRVIGFFKFPEGGTMVGYCEDGGLSGFFIEEDRQLYPARLRPHLERARLDTLAQYGG